MTVGATSARQSYGYTGAGIGVAIIDSGITSWHDDLSKGARSTIFSVRQSARGKFVDFVNSQWQPYDDNGHGTHVAGVVGGNGYDSFGEKAGIAPGRPSSC